MGTTLSFNTGKKCCKEHNSLINVKIHKDVIVYKCEDCGKVTEKVIDRENKGKPLWCKHPNNFIM